MTPRIEEKILISIKQLSEFKEYLYNKKAKYLFPKRKIESLYFDNLQKQMFLDSEEGCVPRKKIRLRRYYNIKDKIYSSSKLELKISSYEGRFKKSINIDNSTYRNYIKKGYLDENYGLCEPKLIVSYNRDYLQLEKVRITIDENISYQKHNSKIFYNDEDIIVEIKANNEVNRDYILNLLPFQRTRFSKYSRGFLKTINV